MNFYIILESKLRMNGSYYLIMLEGLINKKKSTFIDNEGIKNSVSH